MLKNKINKTIKNDPYYKILQQIIKADAADADNTAAYETAEDGDTETEKKAYITVPNYLERPLFTQVKPILICMFQIRMDGLQPFLLYLLEKQNTLYHFTRLPSFDGGKENPHLKRDAINFMENKFSDMGDISYVGFYETPTNNIVILKYSCLDEQEQEDPDHQQEQHIVLPSGGNYAWATPAELINLKKVFNTSISPQVVEFFLQQPSLLYLYNENETRYESPVIGYYSFLAEPASTIDICREKIHPLLGKCYYFNMDIPPITDKSIIMRSILFLGRASLNVSPVNEDKYDSFLFLSKRLYLFNHYSQHFVLDYK
jgi:hypothetical protein